ncbi:conserved hypothetical protein [gamma proteobacterium HTCC5015]|nr:conserved hypothetical protein [gamma proteobacterium HTCC5015]
MQWIRQQAARPILLILFGLAFVYSQFSIAIILEAANATELLLTLQTTFEVESFTQRLAQADAGQLAAIGEHFEWDAYHPIWYGAFSLCLGALLLNLNGIDSQWNGLLWLAPAMAAADVVENALHVFMLTGDIEVSAVAVFTAGLSATIKWMIVGLYSLTMLALIIRWLSLAQRD